MEPESAANWTAAHPTLILSHEVILVDDYKLLTGERGNTHQGFFVRSTLQLHCFVGRMGRED